MMKDYVTEFQLCLKVDTCRDLIEMQGFVDGLIPRRVYTLTEVKQTVRHTIK